VYKAQIDLAAESHELLVEALETTLSMIRSGQTSGADLLADGLAEYDFLVQLRRPPAASTASTASTEHHA